MNNLFCQRLKALRLEKGVTLKEISSCIGVGLMTYAHYEYGDREPSFETLIKLCNYFDVSADYLLGLTDNY